MAEPVAAGGPATHPSPSIDRAEPDPQKAELLLALWERHRGTNMERVEKLESAALALLDGHLPSTLREEATSAAHKLAGSLGTFGFHDGTRIARTAEALLEDDAPDARVLSECVVALLEIIGARNESDATDVDSTTCDPRPQPRPDDHADDHPDDHPDDIASAPRHRPDPARRGDDRHETLLLTSDPELVERLQIASAARRRPLLFSEGATEAQAMLRTGRVAAVLVDLEVGSEQDQALLEGLRGDHPEVRIVALSATDSFPQRIRVARAGGDAFVLRSTPGPRLLDIVHGPALRRPTAAATVAALDDDPLQLSLLGALLSGSRFEVVTTTDAAELWEILERESPSAVLLDLQMPGVDGLVMCRTIRAEPRFHQLPILFLTANADEESVRAIFAAGADDYLAKPLNRSELCARLSSHVERHHLHAATTGTDPLTGVSNRQRSEERLSQLLRLAGRRAEPVSLAIAQVDGVARINRRAGHGTGDTLLRTVAGLFEEHLRDEDVVGRWGSAMFVLGLYGAETDHAVERLVRLVDELSRRRFADLAGRELVATFSAGVSEFPVDGTDLSSVLGAADRALQKAIGSPGTVRSVRSLDHSESGLAQVDVAVVDDDLVLAELLLQSLETAGYSVRHLRDGVEAAELLGGGLLRARLVLLDVGLPGMDGFSVLRVLRDSRLLDTTAVMMLTARSATPETLNALELGAIDFVSKPFSVPVLMERIENVLERSP